MQIVPCPLKCDEGQLWFKDMSAHQKYDCPNRLSRCPLGCSNVLLKKQLQDHVNNSCELRIVDCE